MFGSKPKVAHSVSFVKDPNGAAANDLVSLEKAGHVSLAKRAKDAGVALANRGLAGVRAEGVLIVDHSGSMHGDYNSGAVQTLAERFLGFVLQFDVDGNVPIVAFDDRVHEEVVADVTNYQGIIEREIRLNGRRQMGGTDLRPPLKWLREKAKTTKAPIFAALVSDGDNSNDRHDAETEELFYDLSRYPVFIKPLLVRPVEFFSKIDKYSGPKRLLDNVNAQASTHTRNLLTCDDSTFADAMAEEWDTWVAAATAAGVLR
jgi:hypothetical protein